MLKLSLGSTLLFLTGLAPFCALNVRQRASVIEISNGPDQTIEAQGFPATFKATWHFNRPDGTPKSANAQTKYYVASFLLNLAVAVAFSLSVALVYESIPLVNRLYFAWREHRREMRMLDRTLGP